MCEGISYRKKWIARLAAQTCTISANEVNWLWELGTKINQMCFWFCEERVKKVGAPGLIYSCVAVQAPVGLLLLPLELPHCLHLLLFLQLPALVCAPFFFFYGLHSCFAKTSVFFHGACYFLQTYFSARLFWTSFLTVSCFSVLD